MDNLLQKCFRVNLMKFNKAKWKLLHLGQGSPWCQCVLGEWKHWEQTCWEGLKALLDEKLNKTQQCVLTSQKARHILGCIQSSMVSRVREEILPLCSGKRPLLCLGVIFCGTKQYWYNTPRVQCRIYPSPVNSTFSLHASELQTRLKGK